MPGLDILRIRHSARQCAEKAEDEKIAQSLREQAAFDGHACPEFDLKRGNGCSQPESQPIEENADEIWDGVLI